MKYDTPDPQDVELLPGGAMLTGGGRDAVARVREGLDFAAVERLEAATGFTRERVARFAAIPVRTLARRAKAGRLTTEQSDRLVRAARIFEMTLALFGGDRDAAREWLVSPASALGDEAPLDYATTEVGAREVEAFIGRLEHGVFV